MYFHVEKHFKFHTSAQRRLTWSLCSHVEGSCGNFFEIKKYIITVIFLKKDRSECVIEKK
jgi:hypothetical protein